MNARTARLRLVTCLALAAPLLLALAGCGGGSSDQPATDQQVASGSGKDGSLLSLAQAKEAASQWWNDHEQALLKRDAKTLARIDAEPQVLLEIEMVRASTATGRPILAQPRQPTATRVHVPAEQSWPVPVLAVFDLTVATPTPSAGGTPGTTTEHLAVLLNKLNPGAALVATDTAVLDGPEPAFDTDAAGYVHMGTAAGSLAAAYAQYMQATVHATTPAPSPVPFAPGKLTSQAAANDAALLHDAPGRSHGTLNTVDLDYAQINAPAPVFNLAGGAGGFALLATRRTEVLHPTQGQALLQDPQRRNYGVDLAPGQYQQVTIASVLFLAARIPPGGAPAEVAGSGGGIYQES
jgi:hypothetical protein